MSGKCEDTYAEVKVRETEVSFDILKCSVLCLRGCCSLRQQSEIIHLAIGAKNGRGNTVLVEPPHGIPDKQFLLDSVLQRAMSHIVILI